MVYRQHFLPTNSNFIRPADEYYKLIEKFRHYLDILAILYVDKNIPTNQDVVFFQIFNPEYRFWSLKAIISHDIKTFGIDFDETTHRRILNYELQREKY